jgi:alkylated DNA repair dioxygenase AlkB
MYQVLPDVYHFSQVLSYEEERSLIDALYYSNVSKFYQPKLRSGRKMSIKMNCHGWHWNPKTYQYSRTRDDYDQEFTSIYPEWLNDLVAPFSRAAFPNHNPDWDILICNCYDSAYSKLGTHQDNSESTATMYSGHPIVSISVGASCVFKLGKDGPDQKKIVLDSGDVLIFGDSARMIYHGVQKIIPDTDQHSIGRLNFTMRKM